MSKRQTPRNRPVQDANQSRTTTPGPRGQMAQPKIDHQAEHNNAGMIRALSEHADTLHPAPKR